MTVAKKWNVNTLKAWANKNRQLAMAVLAAKVIAEMERERVDAYTKPIFDKYNFTDDKGVRITDPKFLYRCEQSEEVCTAYFSECITANVRNGWTGNLESCPALTAEHNVVLAENALIEAANGMMGMDTEQVYGENRDKLITILIGTCLAKQSPTSYVPCGMVDGRVLEKK